MRESAYDRDERVDWVQRDDGPVHIHRHRGDGGRLGKEVIWSESDLNKDDAIPDLAQGGFVIDGQFLTLRQFGKMVETFEGFEFRLDIQD